ncbi:MAG: SSU ribosomal protein S11p (S14e), partial [uncultured Nocardioidaceae bacterium]
ASQKSPAGERQDQGAPQGEEERRAGRSAHQEHVQQHDRHDHRPVRRGDLVGLGRHRRLQGLAQVHAVRRADGRRGRRSAGDGPRDEEDRRLRQGPGFRSRDRDPFPGCHRPRGRHHPGRHAHPPQRLPPAQAAPGL